jgi:hypothetical protein
MISVIFISPNTTFQLYQMLLKVQAKQDKLEKEATLT